jgi:hypothetical protein
MIRLLNATVFRFCLSINKNYKFMKCKQLIEVKVLLLYEYCGIVPLLGNVF